MPLSKRADITGLTSSWSNTKSPIITSLPSVVFVNATHPPNPKGVGVDIPCTVILRSLRGILTFSTPSLKSPLRSRDFRTSWYSPGISCAYPDTDQKTRQASIASVVRFMIPDIKHLRCSLAGEIRLCPTSPWGPPQLALSQRESRLAVRRCPAPPLRHLRADRQIPRWTCRLARPSGR